MKFKLKQLQKFFSEKLTYNDIIKVLTDIGLEVENEIQNIEFSNIIVAKIIKAEKHENADKLKVCKVFDGERNYQIVCGANNAREGILVALALPSAIIPNGNFEIKNSKIRGIESQGMLCSKSELNLTEKGDGIWELPENSKIGSNIKEISEQESLIEIKVTPNRGYALNLYGIAKDLSAALNINIKNDILPKFQDRISIKNNLTINSNIERMKYQLVEIRNIENIKTPNWLLEEMSSFNINSFNAIVDILNYVMFTYGQPMHAYDTDKIEGTVFSVHNKDINNFKALNNISYSKDVCFVVSDEKKEIAITGLIGSENTKINESTKNIIIECGYFEPSLICKQNQILKINSEAGKRFERGVDSDLTEYLLNFTIKLIIDNCKGEASNTIIYKSGIEHIKPKKINYNINSFEKIFGSNLEKETQINILNKLGFTSNELENEILEIEIPQFRYYIEDEVQIAEEIGRIIGFEKIIKINRPNNIESNKELEEKYNIISKLKKITSLLGYKEIISIPFVSENESLIFKRNASLENIKILNPINENEPYLQNSLIQNLLKCIKNNIGLYRIDNVKFFELGFIYSKNEEQPSSRENLSGGFLNKELNFEIAINNIKEDIYKIIYNIANIEAEELKIIINENNYNIIFNNKKICSFGQINKKIKKIYNLENERIYYFEFQDINELLKIKKINNKNRLKDVKQTAEREFAFIFEKAFSVFEISKLLEEFEEITNFEIKDIFEIKKENENILKSIAFKIKISNSEVLTNEEIENRFSNIIIERLKLLGGVLRDGISAR